MATASNTALQSFGFLQPPQTEATGKPLESSGLPDWATTTLGLFGGVTGALANAYSVYQTSKNPTKLSDDYEADMRAREREAIQVPASLKLPTWLLVVIVIGGGVLLYKAVD